MKRTRFEVVCTDKPPELRTSVYEKIVSQGESAVTAKIGVELK